jgi:His/Glu/Gln/Arg/opine family amino acid ABC transporter permease subunit
MTLDFERIAPSIPFILQGALVTLEYAGLSIFFGFFLGLLLTLMKLSGIKAVNWFADAYTSVFRGTPLLVQLYLIYQGVPELTGYNITAFEAGILTFSLNSGAYVSEIIRAGVMAVDKGQMEAALSLGVSYPLAMKDIIFPQAIKNILPALVNETINMLKESALVSVIGESDLLRRANIVAAEKYLYFEPLLIAGAMYYVLVLILSWVAKHLEIRLARSD